MRCLCVLSASIVRADLDAGAFGCLRMITVPPTPVHAVAGRSSPVDPIVMPTGEPQEQGVYYIASAWGAGIAEAYFEVTS
jgi:hypothetical protein